MTRAGSIFQEADFSFELGQVAEARAEVDQNITDIAEMAGDSDPRIQRRAERSREKVEEEADFWGDHDDEEILEMAQGLFERGKELEGSGTSAEDLIQVLREENPEALLIYGLLRRNAWGYRLGQAIMAARVREKETG